MLLLTSGAYVVLSSYAESGIWYCRGINGYNWLAVLAGALLRPNSKIVNHEGYVESPIHISLDFFAPMWIVSLALNYRHDW